MCTNHKTIIEISLTIFSNTFQENVFSLTFMGLYFSKFLLSLINYFDLMLLLEIQMTSPMSGNANMMYNI